MHYLYNVCFFCKYKCIIDNYIMHKLRFFCGMNRKMHIFGKKSDKKIV